MSSANPSGPTGLEPPARSRRTPGWAQLGRRSEPAEPLEQLGTLRAIPVNLAEPVEEHHLGERLSGFVDGELGHDSRERVQAHLATCPECLAEADEGRAVKHLLTHSGTPGPSATLMSRLLAVAALPDDDLGGPGPGALPGDPGALGIGGSRLTGGSFGQGAGASFGAGALGAHAPLPGVDPRAVTPARGRRPRSSAAAWPPVQDGPVPDGSVTPLAERAARPHGRVRPAERFSPLAALLPPAAAARPTPPRGRRFVFAAAGAFSVAAVTLGGVGTLSLAGDAQRQGSTVTPAHGGGGPVVPISGEVSVDFPVYPVRASHGAGAVPQAPYSAPAAVEAAIPQHLLR
ncbi:zf-HC2 domain-containing protein [Kitasatospora sp. NPDC002227]|uniref:zf-HC2 domain-containing protein n=1 Tax=Kitasatospora sp. NPDC002227 TaxID=3154773 RepID=UPI00331FAA6A